MTRAFGFEPDLQDQTLFNVLVQDAPLDGAFLSLGPPPPNLTVVPSNLDLADGARRVAGRMGLDSILKTAVQPFLPRFRYVILDCPSSLDLLTLNALVAATEAIVPVDVSGVSVRGMVGLLGTMHEVRKVSPDLPPARILVCRAGSRTVSQTIREDLRKKFGGSVYRAAIPSAAEIPTARAAGRPLPVHAPMSEAAIAYETLAAEVRCA